MNFELTALGQTLAIGGFALFSIIHLLKILQPRCVPRFISSSDGQLQLQYVPVYLALVFGTGILLEAASKRVANRDFPDQYNFFANQLDTDQTLRLRSLFYVKDLQVDEDERTEDFAEIKPRAIASELLQLAPPPGSLLEHFNWIKNIVEEGSQAVNNKLENNGNNPISAVPCTSERDKGYFRVSGHKRIVDLLGHVNGLYYAAKNHAYSHDTYFEELSKIEGRVIFARAFAVLCLFLTALYIPCSLTLGVVLVINRQRNKHLAEGQEQKAWDEGISNLTTPGCHTTLAGRSIYWAHLAGLSVLYFACHLLAAYSFGSEHWNLDTRCFAYSQSMTIHKKMDSEAASKSATQEKSN